MQKALIALLHGYRYAISPLLGNHCRFHPSCSSFAIEALQTHGTVKGMWLATKRVGRCHPWCEGGYDPVPPAQSRPTPTRGGAR